jgi:hypothetical protein
MADARRTEPALAACSCESPICPQIHAPHAVGAVGESPGPRRFSLLRGVLLASGIGHRRRPRLVSSR